MKGAVHLLEDGKRSDLDEETSSGPVSPVKEGDRASDTRRRQLHAMVEQLRPEDTIKLVRSCAYMHFVCYLVSQVNLSYYLIMSQVKVLTSLC